MVRTILKERKCKCGHLPADHAPEDDPGSLDIYIGMPEPCTKCHCRDYDPVVKPYLSLLEPYPSNIKRTVPYYMGFNCKKFTEGVRWEAVPMVPFRMKGFIVWGVTTETMITLFQVTNRMAIIASRDPVPAICFQTGYSFEEFLRLVDDRTRLEWKSPLMEGILKKMPEVLPRQLIDAPSLGPGSSLRVMISGPIDQMAVWGIADVET